MTFQFDKLEAPQTTFVRCGKIVTFDDMVSGLTEFLKIQGRNAPHRVIVDLSSVQDVDLTFREVMRFIPFLSVVLADKKQAFRFALVETSEGVHAFTSVFVRLCSQLPRMDVTLHKTLRDAVDAMGLTMAQVSLPHE